MINYKSKFITSVCENVLLSEMYSLYNDGLNDKCFLDFTSSINISDYCVEQLQASFLTLACVDKEQYQLKNSYYIDDTQVDLLELNPIDKIGIFEEQYDIILDFDGYFDSILDDVSWVASLENILFYLKPKGLFILKGIFSSSTYTYNDYKNRSLGVWKAILRRKNCYIRNFVNTPFSPLDKSSNILVVSKYE